MSGLAKLPDGEVKRENWECICMFSVDQEGPREREHTGRRPRRRREQRGRGEARDHSPGRERPYIIQRERERTKEENTSGDDNRTGSINMGKGVL
jgi:hypothetical protein